MRERSLFSNPSGVREILLLDWIQNTSTTCEHRPRDTRGTCSGKSRWLPSSSAPSNLKNSKIIFTSFNKIWKKNPDVPKGVSHKRAKYQFQIENIMGYTKMIESDKI